MMSYKIEVSRLRESVQIVKMMRTYVLLAILCLDIGNSFGHERTTDPTPELLRANGYKAEEHEVTTDDGYILTLHRIPYGKNEGYSTRKQPKKVVFLQHGLLCSSADFVMLDPKKALGTILADAGYDVWLGNFRGNTYSRNHTTLSVKSHKFWKFSWDHMAKYDLPAMIEKVRNVTGADKIHYVGHSMGTTTFMAMMNIYPEMKDRFLLTNLLSPVAYLGNNKSPIKYLAKLADEIGGLIRLLGTGEFLPNNWAMKILTKLFCPPIQHNICESVIFLLCGFDESQMNNTLLPTLMAHTPAGTSTYTIIQYAQQMESDRFMAMDWGKLDNLRFYGTREPPIYRIEALDLPIAIYSSNNDWLAMPKDVKRLETKLPEIFDNYKVPYEEWNHVDFIWGKDAYMQVYERLLKNLKDFEDKV